MIGRYVVEKTWKVVVYILVLALINILTIFGLTYSTSYLSSAEENSIYASLKTVENVNIVYENNQMSGTKVDVTVLGVNFVFLGEKDEDVQTQYTIIYGESSYQVYFGQFLFTEKKYSEVDVNAFALNSDSTIADKQNMLTLIRAPFLDLKPVIAASNSLMQIMAFMTDYLMLFVIILLLGMPFNPAIKGRFRVRLILNSTISYFFIYWFYLLTDISLLYYLALFIPYLYFILAIKNIVRIERKGA